MGANERGDVAVELRALLREELAGRVQSRGAEPGEATPDDALALLTSFGRPAEVAARYRPTFTIIDPSDSRSFLKASVVGVAFIWLVGLIAAYAHPPASIGDGLLVLRDFYVTVGLLLLLAVLIRGRWEPMTRRAQIVLKIVTCGVASWVLFGGSTFREPGTDQLVKAVIAITVLGMLIDLALRARRRYLAAPVIPTLS